MNIPFSTFDRMHSVLRDEMTAKFQQIYDAGWFIHGPECEVFEREFAAWNGLSYSEYTAFTIFPSDTLMATLPMRPLDSGS